MTNHSKIAITGAASLLGKELNEILSESPFNAAEFLLFDDEPVLGQLEAAGDEVSVVQLIEPGSFDHVDFVFFAGTRESTLKHWQNASRAGASVVDLTGALSGETGVLIRSPWLKEGGAPDLQTPAVVPAHPAAVAVALLVKAASHAQSLRNVSATVLLPASEYGQAAIEELQQQTIGLLNFQNLPKTQFDTQIAFNTTPVFGEESKTDLSALEATVRKHYAILAQDALPEAAIQLIHAPVFHGYGISMALEFDGPVSRATLENAFGGDHLSLQTEDAEAPTNLSSAGEDKVLVRVRTDGKHVEDSQRYWLWATGDNLRLATLNALACAIELRRLRPQGEVQ